MYLNSRCMLVFQTVGRSARRPSTCVREDSRVKRGRRLGGVALETVGVEPAVEASASPVLMSSRLP